MKKYNGYLVQVYKDTNVYSSTYGKEKSTATYNTEKCPLGQMGDKDQYIVWSDCNPKYTSSQKMRLYATATSGLEVKFRVVEGSASIDSDNIITFYNNGTYKVEAYQEGDTEYNAASDIKEFVHLGFGSNQKMYLSFWTAKDIEGYDKHDVFMVLPYGDDEVCVFYGKVSDKGSEYDIMNWQYNLPAFNEKITFGKNVLRALPDSDGLFKVCDYGFSYSPSNDGNLEYVEAFDNPYGNITRGYDSMFKREETTVYTNTTNIVSLKEMFKGQQNLTKVLLNKMDLSAVKTYDGMFEECVNLIEINFNDTVLNTTDITYTDMFKGMTNALTVKMKNATDEMQTFIRNAWVESGNNENNLTIVTA